MAKTVVKDATILLGELDISSLTNNVSFELAPDAIECTAYDSAGWKQYLPGLKGATMPLSGYQDAAVLQPVMFDGMVASGETRPVTIVQTRPVTAGDVAYFAEAFLTSFQDGRSVGAVYSFTSQLERVSPLVRGAVLENLAGAETGDGTGMELTGGVATGQTLYLAVHALASEGTSPTLDLVLESEEDDNWASPTTRITATQIADTGYYIGSVAGPITDTWFRLARTVGGTDTPKFDYIAVIGRT